MTKYSLSPSEKGLKLEAYLNKKIVHPKDLKMHVQKLKDEGLSIATLNGSFDLMHAGHLYILFEAKKVADVLIVALNTDRSIQTYKSKDRPIINLKYRLEMMAAIGFVDFVTYFDEVDPINILDVIKPDVHVNGAEYGEDCIEKSIVLKNGGRLHLVDRIEGLSTSAIIQKIKSL